MLKGMRKNAKRVLWPLTIAMIIAMGGYGVWYLVGPERGAKVTAGTIWGKKVTIEEFLQALRNAQIFTRLTGQIINEPKVFNSLAWEKLLLLEEARKLGITVDPGEVAGLLASLPLFQTEEKFNQQRYLRILEQWGLGQNAFEKQLEDLLAVEKLKRTVQAQALVSETETKEMYDRFNEKVKVEYVAILNDSFKEPVDIPEFTLREYYEKNRGQFELSPRVDIRFVLIERKNFEKDMNASSEEVEAYYRDNPAEFTDNEGKVQDLDDVEDRIEKELIRRKADEALAARVEEIDRTLWDITDIEAVAAKFSLPVGTSGLFSAKDAVPGLGDAPEVNRAAFGMETGEISDPASVPDGFCFFQLLKKEDSRPLAFEEAEGKVRGLVNEALTDQEALQFAQDEQSELLRLMSEEKLSFRRATEELGLEPVTTQFFTREGGEGLPDSPSFVPAAFNVPVGQVSQLFRIDGGYAFLHALERAPAVPMPVDEKEKWQASARREKTLITYNEWFRNLIRRAKLSVVIPDFNPY